MTQRRRNRTEEANATAQATMHFVALAALKLHCLRVACPASQPSKKLAFKKTHHNTAHFTDQVNLLTGVDARTKRQTI